MGVTLTTTLFAILIAAITYYLFWITSYWRRRGVPSYGNIITGCFTEAFKAKENLTCGLDRLYPRVKHERYVGTYLLGQPLLILNDPKIIKEVMLTQYPNFASHGVYHRQTSDPLSGHLFNLKGPAWKSMRSKMTPAFSSAKIKTMFEAVLSKVEIFERKIASQMSQIINCYDYIRRLYIDVTLACFFGIESDCVGDENSVFMEISFLLNPTNYLQFFRFLLFTHHHRLSEQLIAMRLVRTVDKRVSDFILGLSQDIIQLREKDGARGEDFIDMMIRLKNMTDSNDTTSTAGGVITNDTVASQLFVLFAAGFETTSQTTSHAFFEMAKQPEILKKVQEECDRILRETEGKITYDSLSKMEYADRVIKETLRLYPALQFLIRSAIKPCKLPTTDLHLEKDTNIWIPLRAIHKDPQYFPDPEKFDPERFSPENQAMVPPYTYMPFGEGPRTCIGMRFAMIAIKTTFLALLSKYNIEITDQTPKEITFEPHVYLTAVSGSCPLRFVPRNS